MDNNKVCTGAGSDVCWRQQLEINDTVRTTLFGRLTCNPGYKGELHHHNFWELVYIFKNEPDLFEMTIVDKHMVCYDNTLFLIPPGMDHIFCNTGKLLAQNIYIGFEYDYMPEKRRTENFPTVMSTDSPYVTRTIAMLNEIAMPINSCELTYTLDRMRREIMYSVINIINLMIEDTELESSSAVRRFIIVDKIKEYIMNNLDHHITVDEIAKQLYLSPNYLGQMFRQHTGMTIKSYHNKMRMDAALKLLITGEKTVSEIADEMGFESIAYFSRRFKMSYGFSPSQLTVEQRKA